MDESQPKRQPRRRWVVRAALAALVGLLLWWFMAWPVTVATRLSGDVVYIEYRPNIDWPPRRITDPKRITAFKRWLSFDTHRASSLRSAPPLTVCELRVRFRDGHEEKMWISATKPALQEGVEDATGIVDGIEIPVRYGDVRSDVRVSWRGYIRDGGGTDRLNEILFTDKTGARIDDG